MTKKQQYPQEQRIIPTLIFLFIISYHIFILHEQRGVVYTIIMVAYLAFIFIAKIPFKNIFLHALILIAATPIFILLDMNEAAKVLMDYVFLFLLLGLIIQYVNLLKKSLQTK